MEIEITYLKQEYETFFCYDEGVKNIPTQFNVEFEVKTDTTRFYGDIMLPGNLSKLTRQQIIEMIKEELK